MDFGEYLPAFFGPFDAQITAVTTVGGLPVYSWTEQSYNPSTGAYAVLLGGRSGTSTLSPAYEINNTTVAVPNYVIMRFRCQLNGGPVYEFQFPGGVLPQTLSQPAVATANEPGVTIENPTTSTVSVTQQNSPGIILQGTGWDTGLVASVPLQYLIQLISVSGNPALPKLGFLDQENAGGLNLGFWLEGGVNPKAELDTSTVGTSQLDGFVVKNLTSATAGNQQNSPLLRMTGSGWKTASTAAAQPVDWALQCAPVQGSSAPSGILDFLCQIAGAGYAVIASLTSAGLLTATSFAGNGSSLTNLNASNISTGTVPSGNLPVGSSSQLGIVEVDNTTITASAGVISAVAAGATNSKTSGTGTTTSTFVQIVSLTNSSGLHGNVALKNTAGVNSLSYKASYTDMFGNANTFNASPLSAGTYINFDLGAAGSFDGSFAPFTTFTLQVEDTSGGSHATFSWFASVVG